MTNVDKILGYPRFGTSANEGPVREMTPFIVPVYYFDNHEQLRQAIEVEQLSPRQQNSAHISHERAGFIPTIMFTLDDVHMWKEIEKGSDFVHIHMESGEQFIIRQLQPISLGELFVRDNRTTAELVALVGELKKRIATIFECEAAKLILESTRRDTEIPYRDLETAALTVAALRREFENKGLCDEQEPPRRVKE